MATGSYKRLKPEDNDKDQDDKEKKRIQRWDASRTVSRPKEILDKQDRESYKRVLEFSKGVTYIVTFGMVLGCSVVARLTLLLMTSQLKRGTSRPICLGQTTRHWNVEVPTLARIQWTWAIFFCFIGPEILTFCKSLRIHLFKRVKAAKETDQNDYSDPAKQTPASRSDAENSSMPEEKPGTPERTTNRKRLRRFLGFLVAAFFEVNHVVGLGLFIFCVLPQVHVVMGSMLGNAVCILPALLSLLSRHRSTGQCRPSRFAAFFDAMAALIQISCIAWPIIVASESDYKMKALWVFPLSVILISFGWWENYVSTKSEFRLIQLMAKIRNGIDRSRSLYYVVISVLKMAAFLAVMCLSVRIMGDDPQMYFTNFSTAIFDDIVMNVTQTEVTLAQGMIVENSMNPTLSTILRPAQTIVNSDHAFSNAIIVQVIMAYLCYATAKFACKICIQEFSFALPVTLSVPATITILVSFCGTRMENVCFGQAILPDYLFWNCPAGDFSSDFLSKELGWLWALVLISQLWLTIHIWFPTNRPLADSNTLFCKPKYSAYLTDLDLALNRKQEIGDISKLPFLRQSEESMTVASEAEPATEAPTDFIFGRTGSKEDWNLDCPRVIACATMWHEEPEEMLTLLKGLVRMDEQHALRQYAQVDYFQFESHIFFDDAFDKVNLSKKKDIERLDFVINDWASRLIPTVQKAMTEIYGAQVLTDPPTVIPTPYGGRIVWSLPGGTKLNVHLKNKTRIRHKKRWSQCMYMYYLLGFGILDNDTLTDEEKDTVIKNTFLLALDGDIDFQPQAVDRVLEIASKDEKIGAVCGRIHPVGSGPIVWYQQFEYAISHWFQKATEHMVGCVLCSPGCFSLFRGEALLDTNVMNTYTTVPTLAIHHVQYDQGEDRWLCTLLLQQGWRVAYCAASDSFTNSPFSFFDFFKQRRRWIPSTMANILDLLQDSEHTVKQNPNISRLYMWYQALLLVGGILGPGTIFLMLVGAFVTAFGIDNYTSFYINVVPVIAFMLVCYSCKEETQLTFALVLSLVYGLVMVAVLVALLLQMFQDGPLAPSSLFLIGVASSFIIAAMLHPLEWSCIIHGVVYYITIPAMYLLLIIFSLFNLNNTGWGTRETKEKKEGADEDSKENGESQPGSSKDKKSGSASLPDVIKDFASKKKAEGSLEFSLAGLFKFMCCVQENPMDDTVLMLKSIRKEIIGQNEQMEIRLKRALNATLPDTRRNSIVSSSNVTSPGTPKSLSVSFAGAFMPQQLLEAVPEANNESIDEEEEDEIIERDDLVNPYWADSSLLSEARRDFLTGKELKFWQHFIKKYLKPFENTQKDKDKVMDELLALRNNAAGAFFMLNAVFVTALFLLQLNKDTIFIDWPLGGTSTFTYDPADNNILLQTEYLHLEPLGLLFVAVFAIILGIQFMGMLFHRFSTFSQIMTTTKLELFSSCLSGNKNMDMSGKQILKLLKKGAREAIAENDDDEVDASPEGEHTPSIMRRRNTMVGNIFKEAAKEKSKVLKLREVLQERFGDDAQSSGKPDLSKRKSVSFIKTSSSDLKLMAALTKRRQSVNLQRRQSAVLERRGSALPLDVSSSSLNNGGTKGSSILKRARSYSVRILN